MFNLLGNCLLDGIVESRCQPSCRLRCRSRDARGRVAADAGSVNKVIQAHIKFPFEGSSSLKAASWGDNRMPIEAEERATCWVKLQVLDTWLRLKRSRWNRCHKHRLCFYQHNRQRASTCIEKLSKHAFNIAKCCFVVSSSALCFRWRSFLRNCKTIFIYFLSGDGSSNERVSLGRSVCFRDEMEENVATSSSC